MVEMWDNPACSKCAAARTELAAAGVPVALRPYLDAPPTPAELAAVLDRLGVRPWDVCRLGEPVAAELGLAARGRTPADVPGWIEAMAAHPELIQRPILLTDDGGAVVARTPGAIAEAIRRTR
ncbi:arsenate reductase [Pilimelia anulata]|uniref:Arsenate reductase n=1 Tax=Pilimelia anulata TaxID=53371 RepID=A0A8J3F8L5_9ACTN|nr:ArsC/Spx/MgsR family protein [Pilimelia anulata]GGJ79348.1 arsenate reductase [Pilimelia anulata]